jgi:hypothetical protein
MTGFANLVMDLSVPEKAECLHKELLLFQERTSIKRRRVSTPTDHRLSCNPFLRPCFSFC